MAFCSLSLILQVGIKISQIKANRGYCFKLGEIKNSFVTIFRENVLFLNRMETNWLAKLLNHKKDSAKIIMKFWHPKLSEKYEMFTTINATPSFTLEELSKNIPEIPLDAVGLEVETDSNSWTQASILVNRLLESDL